MHRSLQEWANGRGYRIAWGCPGVVDEVRSEVDRRREAGSEYVRELLDVFSYLKNEKLPQANAVVVVAVPRPAHRVTFDTGRGVFEVVVPPTYAWHGKVRRQVKHELETIVLKGKYRVATLRAPLKAIAARLGLVTYGRNSLTYAPGMGSYHQLMGFLTDATVEPRPTCAARCAEISSECECCQACRSACPTGAIRADRLMLEAEKCVTLHNGSTRAWPGWIPESAHNCLVGCLICQEVCPQNEGLLRLEPAGVSFTEEETRAILSDNADHSSSAWGAIKTKLNAAGMVYLESVMGRNLKALMAQEGSSGGRRRR